MLRKAHSLGRHGIQSRRLNLLASVTAEIPVAEIIRQDINNIGLIRTDRAHNHQENQEYPAKFHAPNLASSPIHASEFTAMALDTLAEAKLPSYVNTECLSFHFLLGTALP